MKQGQIVVLLVASIVLSLAPIAPANAHRRCGSSWKGEAGYAAIVDLSDLCIYLSDGRSFPIAGPADNSFTPKGVAIVRAVVIDPVWWPTEKTRAAYAEKHKKKGLTLPESVAPYVKDKRNAMGRLKVILDFSGLEGQQVFRIHGTNKANSIGRRESRGCIRLHNDHAILVGQFLNKGDKVLFRT